MIGFNTSGWSTVTKKPDVKKPDMSTYYTTIQDDNILKIKPSGDKCYICGRTEEDCKNIKSSILDEIDSRIKADNLKIEELINTKKESLLKIITSVSNNAHLDFSVKTVKNDFPAFSGLIPNLQDLLKYSINDEETINDIKMRIEGYFDQNKNLILDTNTELAPIKELNKSIQNINEDIKNLTESREIIDKDTNFSLSDYSMYYTLDGHRVFIIPPPNGPAFYHFDGQSFRKDDDYQLERRSQKRPMKLKIDVKVCKLCADLILYPAYIEFNYTAGRR